MAGNINNVYLYGGIMVVMAALSLTFGILSGRCSAKAGSGFAYNLRDAMYKNIQTFSFSSIDKFSTSGLITRMTTDVNNLQNAFQMILRVSVRAPLTMIFSIHTTLPALSVTRLHSYYYTRGFREIHYADLENASGDWKAGQKSLPDTD